jgi:hypothetical protein
LTGDFDGVFRKYEQAMDVLRRKPFNSEQMPVREFVLWARVEHEACLTGWSARRHRPLPGRREALTDFGYFFRAVPPRHLDLNESWGYPSLGSEIATSSCREETLMVGKSRATEDITKAINGSPVIVDSSMRSQFPSFFPLKKEEYADFLRSAVISYDANILLNIYRVKPDTAQLFYELLGKTEAQTWISYQATYEFLRNRESVILEHSFSQSNKRICDFVEKAKENLSSISPFRFDKIQRIASDIDEFFKGCIQKLSEIEDTEKNLLEEDPFLEKIEELSFGRIGKKPSEEIMKQLYRNGDERYKKKIPPGFNDDKKIGDDKFGDLLIWDELLKLLKHCKIENKNLVFVTDDEKDDWWNIVNWKKMWSES